MKKLLSTITIILILFGNSHVLAGDDGKLKINESKNNG